MIEKLKSHLIRLLIISIKQLRNKQASAPAAQPLKLMDLLFDLTPKVDIAKNKSYCEALDWGLRNNDVNNIALSGPYGSGKSSIIKTLRSQDIKNKYLLISLAAFKDVNVDEVKIVDENAPKDIESRANKTLTPELRLKKLENTKNKNKTILSSKDEVSELHAQIELSILQQMIYKERVGKLPQSRFKRISSLPFSQIWWIPTSIALWVLSYLYLFNDRIMRRLESWDSMTFDKEVFIIFTASLTFISGVFFGLTFLTMFLRNAKFSRVNLTSGEIEMTKDVDSSILNKYLDEIIYFFERTKYNVVVIEDLDRFNDPEIFTKLRELNMFLNNSQQIKRRLKSSIKFIYAIRDDIFEDKNRTKFFDLIIPVIPHVNSYNSLDVILPHLEHANIKLPRKFLYDIMLYIDDMRVLNNVLNEFNIYRINLNHQNLSIQPDSLFGIIVYKNIYPKDFSDLHHKEGNLYDVFALKPLLIDYLVNEFNSELEKLNDRKKNLLAENLTSEDELRRVYVQELTMAIPNATRVKLDSWTLVGSLAEESNFSKLKALQRIDYESYDRTNGLTTGTYPSFKEVEKKLSTKGNFDERVKNINSKNALELDSIESRLNDIYREVNITKSKPLQTILKENKTAIDFFPDRIAKNRLLVYLIRGGYITEMYDTYISYFYAQSLGGSDVEFLRKLRNLDHPEFDLKLENPSELMNRLEPNDFSLDEILNLDLISYLISNSKKYPKHCHCLFLHLSTANSITLNFVQKFLQIQTELQHFISGLAETWDKFWWFIITSEQFTLNDQTQILKLLIQNTSAERLIKLNIDNTLSAFIAEKPIDFLNMFEEAEEVKKVEKIMGLLDIKLASLTKESYNSNLFPFVLENDHYTISYDMVKLMINYNADSDISSDFDLSNYTTIKKYGQDYSYPYVTNDINLYLENIYFELENNIQESYETIKFFLCNENISLEDKKRILIKNQKVLNNIDGLPADTLPFAFQYSKIDSSWDNIIGYYHHCNNEFDDILIAFLNEKPNHANLILDDFSLDYKDDEVDSFVEKLILERKISPEAFRNLAHGMPREFVDTDIIQTFSEDRLNDLIVAQKLMLNPFNFKTLSDLGFGNQTLLISENIDQYFKEHTQYELTTNDYISLFKKEGLSTVAKRKLVKNIPIDQTTNKPDFCECVLNLYAIGIATRWDFAFIKHIFTHAKLIHTIVQAFNKIAPQLTTEQVKILVSIMPGVYSLPKKPVSFIINDQNRKFLRILKSNGIIKEPIEKVKVLLASKI